RYGPPTGGPRPELSRRLARAGRSPQSWEVITVGMPGIAYSFYPLLYNLASPSRPYYRKAVQAVEPFSLFAFVLCSPDKGDGTRDVLSRYFAYLDLATADRLLFYAPIDEPPEWRLQRESCPIAKSLFDFHDVIRYACRSDDLRGTEH